MEEITQIKIMMTIAFVFYVAAIVLGRNQIKWKLPRWVHISAGSTGFFLDMWATWDMEQLRSTGWGGFEDSLFLTGHTIVSTLAVLLFLVMITLGIRKKIAIHRVVVWYAFAPVWFISYTSGLILVSVNDENLVVYQPPLSTYERSINIMTLEERLKLRLENWCKLSICIP